MNTQVIPLHGFLQGDTLGLLIVVNDEQSVGEVARQLQEAADVRVRLGPSVVLVHDGRELDPSWTVRQAGMRPLDRVDVIEVRSAEPRAEGGPR